MKIYTKVVIDIKTGKVLESDSFDYKGEVALCCGGGDAPKPSKAEKALQREQLSLLQQQQEETELMRPFVLEGLGLVTDPSTGELRHMTEAEKLAGMSESQRRQYDITTMAQERQMKAYAGELPVSPALEQELEKQHRQLTEALSQRLGTGWMETTAGQQAMSTFMQKANLVREEARRGEITGGTSSTLSNLSYMGGAREAKASGAYAFPSRTSGLFGEYSGVLDRMSNERMMQYQAETQQQAGMMSGYGQLIGSGMQAGATVYGLSQLAPLAVASSKILKENIETIDSPIEKIVAIRGVGFDWKKNGEHDVGVIAEEVEKVIPEAVVKVDGVNHVYYHKIIPLLVEVVKEQQGQINALKGGCCHA